MSRRSNYRLLGLVGQGQFGQVFCAASRQTGRLVALKRLDHQRFPTHKFLRELRFLLSLRHPHIVSYQAIEHTATSRHLVMDYCEGGTLRSLMTEETRLSLPQSLKLVEDILLGLAHAHSRSIVHCDVKPENILLTTQQQGWQAKISDFGIARLSQEADERDTGNTGSPAYMAPERFYGEYSLTSDLYAVGVLLFELIAGHRPFSGTPAELMSAHLNQPVEMPNSIPDCWQPFIRTALQKLSARRFRSANDMLAALRSIAAQEPDARQPLLTAVLPPPECYFAGQQQPLAQPIAAVAIAENRRVQAYLNQAICQYAAILPSQGWINPAQISLDHPAEALVVRSQGCFVLTQRSVHLIPHQRPLLTLLQDSATAISPQGDWLAALHLNPAAEAGSLSFFQLSNRAMKLATAVEVPLKGRSSKPQLFALDARHVAIAMTLTAGDAFSRTSGTFIKVLTRRGSIVGSLRLPLCLGQVIVTSTPYRLLAIDADNPELVAIIDLKPYRIRRFAAGIAPTLLSATGWGYIVANQHEVALLDLEGRQLGQMAAPASITAIAPFNQRGLLVATWTGQQGNLYTLDLNEIGADLVF